MREHANAFDLILSRADGLLTAIQRKPVAAFVIFVLVHVTLWTVVPAILQTSLQTDVIEGIAYGRDWQLGYWKHPPLPWILMDLTRQIFGGRLWPFFLLGQLAAATAFWAVWRLGCDLFTPLEAFVAVVVLDGEIEFGYRTSQFNNNVAELPFFALAGWSLYRAFVGDALRDWLLVGLWFALACYTKYQILILLVPALLFSIFDRQARHCWHRPGPYIAAVVCVVLCAPQITWMAFVDHFSAISFAASKADPAHSLLGLLWATADFAGSALVRVVPVALLFFLLNRWAVPKRPASGPASDSFSRRYLAVLAFGPLATCVAGGLLSGRHLPSGWTELLWCFISLYLMAAWRPTVDRAALGRLLVGWCGITGFLVAAKVATEVFLIAQGVLMQSQFPGQQFSDLVTAAWHEEVGTAPLSYLIGENWAPGNVILFSKEHPRMLESGDSTHSPLVDTDDIRRRGAVIFSNPTVALNRPPPPATNAPWLAKFPAAQPRLPFVIRQKTLRGEITWVVPWAMLKPDSGN